MRLLHNLPIHVSVLWAAQFIGSAGTALALPRKLWPFRVLLGISALADIAECVIVNGTQLYAHVYWGFRIVELMVLVAASCFLAGRYIPRLDDAFRMPLLCAFALTLANGVPSNNIQMEIYQEAMLLIASTVLWLALFVRWGLHLWLLTLAMTLLAALELACSLIWRYWAYNTEMWFIAWITGTLLIWMADHGERGHYPSL